MKKALSMALLIAMPAVLFVTGIGQEEPPVAELFEQEVAVMQEAFGGVQAFMMELISEVKMNMGDIDVLQADAQELRDFAEALAIELKSAEGKIVGLQNSVSELGANLVQLGEGQEQLRARVVALEAGIAELSAFLEDCCRRLEMLIASQRAEIDAAIAEILAAVDELAGRLALLEERFTHWAEDYAVFKEECSAFRGAVSADLLSLHEDIDALAMRVQILEDEDVGSFKRKVIELERNMAALSIKVDNNRTKLEGFDHAFGSFASDIELNASGLLSALSLVEDHEVRLMALEDGSVVAELQEQVNSLYFMSILGLLAGLGALIWSFLGTS